MNVNRGPEPMEQRNPLHETNVRGRGGEGNIGTGLGHYDASGGHDEGDLHGRGGTGNMLHDDQHTAQKATVVDKAVGQLSPRDVLSTSINFSFLSGSAQVAIGKLTKNPSLVEKGTERKTRGRSPF